MQLLLTSGGGDVEAAYFAIVLIYWLILTWIVKMAGIIDWKCWIMKDFFKD